MHKHIEIFGFSQYFTANLDLVLGSWISVRKSWVTDITEILALSVFKV